MKATTIIIDCTKEILSEVLKRAQQVKIPTYFDFPQKIKLKKLKYPRSALSLRSITTSSPRWTSTRSTWKILGWKSTTHSLKTFETFKKINLQHSGANFTTLRIVDTNKPDVQEVVRWVPIRTFMLLEILWLFVFLFFVSQGDREERDAAGQGVQLWGNYLVSLKYFFCGKLYVFVTFLIAQNGNLDTHTALIYDAVLLFASALDHYSRIQVDIYLNHFKFNIWKNALMGHHRTSRSLGWTARARRPGTTAARS